MSGILLGIIIITAVVIFIAQESFAWALVLTILATISFPYWGMALLIYSHAP